MYFETILDNAYYLGMLCVSDDLPPLIMMKYFNDEIFLLSLVLLFFLTSTLFEIIHHSSLPCVLFAWLTSFHPLCQPIYPYTFKV